MTEGSSQKLHISDVLRKMYDLFRTFFNIVFVCSIMGLSAPLRATHAAGGVALDDVALSFACGRCARWAVTGLRASMQVINSPGIPNILYVYGPDAYSCSLQTHRGFPNSNLPVNSIKPHKIMSVFLSRVFIV